MCDTHWPCGRNWIYNVASGLISTLYLPWLIVFFSWLLQIYWFVNRGVVTVLSWKHTFHEYLYLLFSSRLNVKLESLHHSLFLVISKELFHLPPNRRSQTRQRTQSWASEFQWSESQKKERFVWFFICHFSLCFPSHFNDSFCIYFFSLSAGSVIVFNLAECCENLELNVSLGIGCRLVLY